MCCHAVSVHCGCCCTLQAAARHAQEHDVCVHSHTHTTQEAHVPKPCAWLALNSSHARLLIAAKSHAKFTLQLRDTTHQTGGTATGRWICTTGGQTQGRPRQPLTGASFQATVALRSARRKRMAPTTSVHLMKEFRMFCMAQDRAFLARILDNTPDAFHFLPCCLAPGARAAAAGG